MKLLAEAATLYSRLRATDTLEPIVSMAAGRTDELTASMQALVARTPAPRDPADEGAIRTMRAAARQFFRTFPVLVCPVATHVAPPQDVDAPFETGSFETGSFETGLAPCRAVSLLGLAALTVPAGRDSNGVPVGVQLVGRLPELLWTAQSIEAGQR
jgi:amidase